MNSLNNSPDTDLQRASVSVSKGFRFAKPELNEELMLAAKEAMETAKSDNIVDRCQKYLILLDNYRNELYKFRGSPEINRELKFSLPSEAVNNLRKQIRADVEKTTRERNKVELLLKSFTSISGYEAVETLNRLQYKELDDWELKAGGVKSISSSDNGRLSIQDAVELAGLLRREEYTNRLQTV